MNVTSINGWMRKVYKDGEPCEHKGCINHVKQPCEGCGRIQGKGIVVIPRYIWEYETYKASK